MIHFYAINSNKTYCHVNYKKIMSVNYSQKLKFPVVLDYKRLNLRVKHKTF